MNLCDFHGWDPVWGSSDFGPHATAPDVAEQAIAETNVRSPLEGHDPHLRSLSEVIGYDIRASNGAIGHLENVVLDDENLEHSLSDHRYEELMAWSAFAAVTLRVAGNKLV